MNERKAPEPSDASRDEHLASVLAVEALDDLTRRRLVRTALDRSRSRRRVRAVVAVAAATLAVVVGLGVALTRETGSHHETASRAPARTPLESTASPAPTGAPPASPESLPFLGDHGDLQNRSDLEALRRAAASLHAASSTSAERQLGAAADAGSVPVVSGDLAAARACPSAPRSVVAYATGTYRGKTAVVLVTPRHMVAVVPETCEVHQLG